MNYTNRTVSYVITRKRYTMYKVVTIIKLNTLHIFLCFIEFSFVARTAIYNIGEPKKEKKTVP